MANSNTITLLSADKLSPKQGNASNSLNTPLWIALTESDQNKVKINESLPNGICKKTNSPCKEKPCTSSALQELTLVWFF